MNGMVFIPCGENATCSHCLKPLETIQTPRGKSGWCECWRKHDPRFTSDVQVVATRPQYRAKVSEK
jgi:hypothetical protein